MDYRTNEGYIIVDSILVGETEYVLGKLVGKIPMYVTWACKGGDNYYWGHYFPDLLEAKKDLLDRAGQELEILMARRAQAEAASERQDKEREEQ